MASTIDLVYFQRAHEALNILSSSIKNVCLYCIYVICSWFWYLSNALIFVKQLAGYRGSSLAYRAGLVHDDDDYIYSH